MFCVKCGQQLRDGVKFCTNCGHPVETAGKPQQAPVQPQQAPVQPQQAPVQSQQVPVQPQPIPVQPAAAVSNTSGAAKKKKPVALIVTAVVLGVLLFLLAAVVGIKMVWNHEGKRDDSNVTEEGYDAKNQLSPQGDGEQLETVPDGDDADEEQPNEEQAENSEDIELLSADTKEGQLQREIMEMNSDSYEQQMINVYQINRKAGQRDTGYAWDQTVFYSLEGLNSPGEYINKDQHILIKKELINKANNHVMDYEIYVNPSTNVANKIVSIEYLDDGIEVTEYYYTKNKKPNFVFQYKTDNYASTFATPDKKGQRFLFHNDCMTTWRRITDGGTKNYIIGQNELNRLKNQHWASNSLVLYQSLDADMKEKFNKYEKKMLNAAYNTYETVMNAEGISMIQGYVYDQGGSGMATSVIELYDETFAKKLFSTITDENGTYRIYVPFEEYNYNVRVIKDGYEDCDIYRVAINNEQIGVYQDSVYLFAEGGSDTSVSMTLGDAFNYNSSGNGMMRLSSAQVNIRKGINNRNGDEIVYSGITDGNGYIMVSLKPGVYTLEVIASGYETMYYTIIANPILSNIYEFFAAPKLNDGEYAIVLTWGDQPYDLDSHLFTNKSDENHIWYGRKSDSLGNNLDVDDMDSYGPETVTIQSLQAGDYYKYCVVDFTDCSNENYDSYAMSESQATVNVYSSDGLVGTFHVPTNTPGVIWEVFEIRNGRLTPIQRYYDNVTNKDWWHQDK